MTISDNRKLPKVTIHFLPPCIFIRSSRLDSQDLRIVRTRNRVGNFGLDNCDIWLAGAKSAELRDKSAVVETSTFRSLALFIRRVWDVDSLAIMDDFITQPLSQHQYRSGILQDLVAAVPNILPVVVAPRRCDRVLSGISRVVARSFLVSPGRRPLRIQKHRLPPLPHRLRGVDVSSARWQFAAGFETCLRDSIMRVDRV